MWSRLLTKALSKCSSCLLTPRPRNVCTSLAWTSKLDASVPCLQMKMGMGLDKDCMAAENGQMCVLLIWKDLILVCQARVKTTRRALSQQKEDGQVEGSVLNRAIHRKTFHTFHPHEIATDGVSPFPHSSCPRHGNPSGEAYSGVNTRRER